jgi:signal recognition particle receptor subunit beta
MSVHKIIFSGPVGAGKTTSIAAISDVEPFVTEQYATDATQNRKEQTTVAMDYGMLKLENNERIHLYGTPGQERFNFMWDILTDGGVGLILLVDNKRANPLDDLSFFLQSFKGFIEETAVVVGVTRMDIACRPGLDDYRRVMRELSMNIPILEVDAREKNDVIYLVQTLLYCLDPRIAA